METGWMEVNEPISEYKNYDKYPLQEETFRIIEACFEVYNEFGKGFQEVVYKDALMPEFNLKGINFEREKKYEVFYKGVKLSRYYFAVYDNIILEVKAQAGVIEDHYRQVLNYLAVSKCKVGLIVNFGENSLKYKRVIL